MDIKACMFVSLQTTSVGDNGYGKLLYSITQFLDSIFNHFNNGGCLVLESQKNIVKGNSESHK